MSGNSDESIRHAWDVVLQELIAQGKVSEDVLHDSDTIVQRWRSLDSTKQTEIIGRVREVSQGREVGTTIVEKQTHQKKNRMMTEIMVGIVIAIIALVVCFVPLKEVAYTATEPLSYQEYQEMGFVVKEQQPDPDPRSIHATVEFASTPEEVRQALIRASAPK